MNNLLSTKTSITYKEAVYALFGAKFTAITGELEETTEEVAVTVENEVEGVKSFVKTFFKIEEKTDIMKISEERKEGDMKTIKGSKYEMTFKTTVNRLQAKDKEHALRYIAAIKNNNSDFAKSDIIETDLKTLAKAIESGRAIVPAVIEGRLVDSNFKQQQLFALDIDDMNLSLNELKAKFKKYPFAMIYTSFSHTEEKPKYRFLFVSDRVVTNADEARAVNIALMKLAGTADEKCKDLARIFFAGKEVLEIKEKTFNVDKLLKETNTEIQVKLTKSKIIENIIKQEMTVKEVEAVGEDNKTITIEEVKANLSKIKKFNGMELDFVGSFEWLNQNISLATALSKEKNTFFRCLHSEHLDRKPSSKIFEYEDKEHIICSCNHFSSPKTLMDTLSEILDMDKVELQYEITEALEITLGSQYQKECRLLIADTKANLLKMIKADTILYKEMKFLWGALNVIQDFASAKVTTMPLTKNNKRPTFFMSASMLSNEMKRLTIAGYSIVAVKNKLNQLKDLGFIRPLSDEELTEKALNKALENKEKCKILLNSNAVNRIEFYELCAITPSMIRKAEKIISTRKELGAKKKNAGIARRINTFGTEHVEIVNVQTDVDAKVEKMVENKKYKKIIDLAKGMLKDKKYFTEKELAKAFNKNGNYKVTLVEKMINDCIPAILNETGAKKKRISKATKLEYSLPEKLKSNSFIYAI